jgi:hypothetical protein
METSNVRPRYNVQYYQPKMYKKNCATPKETKPKSSATYAQGIGNLWYMIVHVIKTIFTMFNILARPMLVNFYFKVN